MAKWSHQHTVNAGLIVIGILSIVIGGVSLFTSKILVREMAERGGIAAPRAMDALSVVTAVSIVIALVLCLALLLLINRLGRAQNTARLRAEDGQAETNAAREGERATSLLKDEFLATISHELRNPLAPILTWTQLLRSGKLDKSRTERGLDVIEQNVVTLTELIDDLVDVSKVVSGNFRLDRRAIDAADVVRTAAEARRPACEAKRVRLNVVMDEPPYLISGDSDRLQQIVADLISNAVKFTPAEGAIDIALTRASSHVELSVSDSGIGIDAAFLPHVFEPFRQATDGSTRRHGGLGLGLSIVRHVVEMHGGTVLAESGGAGRGSRFTIKLPLLGQDSAPAGEDPRHPTTCHGVSDVLLRRLDRVRVLIVDDEPTANEAVQALLESCGAEVKTAGSVAQAMQIIDSWTPDVLLSDIAMPEEDGFALIKKVRALSPERGGETPAVALTAFSKTEDRVNILAAGFQMYLSKPADPSELMAVVASLAVRRQPPVEIPELTR